jgi:hypothetical protein
MGEYRTARMSFQSVIIAYSPRKDLTERKQYQQALRWRASPRNRAPAWALCGGGRRWRLWWPWGRRLRWLWRQHGATHSGSIRSSRTRTEVALEDKAHDRHFGERHSRR